MEIKIITHNEQETIDLGYQIGKKLFKGACICLKGDLAGGKTTFTKGIGKAINSKSIINSPTFTILKIHHGDLDLYHIDAYRLENNEYDLGISEYLDEGIMVIEWPEYYESFLPEQYLTVEFSYVDDDTRILTFKADSDKYKKVIEDLAC